MFPLSLVFTILVFFSSSVPERFLLQSPCFQRLYSEHQSRGSLSNEILDKISKTSFLPKHFTGQQHKLAGTSKAACFLSSILGKQNCGSQNIVNFYDFILFLFYTDFYCLLYYCNFIFYFRRPKGHCNIKSSKFAVNKFQTEFNLPSNRNAEFKNVFRILHFFMYKLDNKQ